MLEFKVENQKLTRLDVVEPATDSEQYLKAKFTFNDADWNGKAKTALFRMGELTYKAVLDSNNECVVPSEVLVHDSGRYARTQGSKIYVSLIGEYSTTRITTDEVCVVLNASGYTEALTPKKPTESEYQQIVTQYANNEAAINEAKAECETARADLAGVKNIFANGIKGNLSGGIVSADDVSPIEHNPIVKALSRNKFDISNYVTEKDHSNGQMICAISAENLVIGKEYKVFSKVPMQWFKISNSATGYSCVGLQNDTVGFTSYTFTHQRHANIHESNPLNIYVNNLEKTAMYDTSIMDSMGICIVEVGESDEYTPYIDPTTVTVTRCGKNFWHSKNLTYPRTVSGVTIDYDAESQIYTFNGTSTSAGDLYVLPNNTHIMTINAGETWTLKVEVMGGNIDGVATSSGKISPLVNTSDYTNTIHANSETLYSTKKYTEAADITKMYFYVYASGIVFNDFKCRIQFELNNKPTEFEKHKDMSDFTPSADGTVEGITSLSPNMTILTDTEGAIVECEYIKDTNKVLQKIADALNITI